MVAAKRFTQTPSLSFRVTGKNSQGFPYSFHYICTCIAKIKNINYNEVDTLILVDTAEIKDWRACKACR